MQLLLNEKFVDEKGKKLEEGNTQGEFLGFIMANSQGNEARKFWNWCTILSKNEILEIDKTDFDKLLTFVEYI